MFAELMFIFAMSMHMPNDWTLVHRTCAVPEASGRNPKYDGYPQRIDGPVYKGRHLNLDEGLQVRYYVVNCTEV